MLCYGDIQPKANTFVMVSSFFHSLYHLHSSFVKTSEKIPVKTGSRCVLPFKNLKFYFLVAFSVCQFHYATFLCHHITLNFYSLSKGMISKPFTISYLNVPLSTLQNIAKGIYLNRLSSQCSLKNYTDFCSDPLMCHSDFSSRKDFWLQLLGVLS